MDDRSLEIKVGAFLLLALAGAFGVFWLFRGAVGGAFGGIPLVVDFGETAGLADGAPVRLAGVVVGRVEGLELFPTRRDDAGRPLPVRLRLRIQSRLRPALTQGTRFAVASNGPLGEPFLELSPGAPEAAPLPDGSALRGEDPPRLDRMIARFAKLFDHVADQLAQHPDGLQALAQHVDLFVADADQLMRDARPDLLRTVKDAADTAAEAKALAAEARPLLADLRREAPPLLAHLEATAGKVDAFTDKLDPADLVVASATLHDARAAAERLNRVAERADRILGAVERGDGSVGQALKDQKLYEDLKALVADLKAHPWKVLWKN